ncbi:hypothetical protein ACVWXR_002264 [Pseudomonas lurida]
MPVACGALITTFASKPHPAFEASHPGTIHQAGEKPGQILSETQRMTDIIPAFRGEQTFMPTSFLEIVELPDGRIELRRAEDEGSLVILDFSEDAKVFLQGQHVEVAKAMLSVGVQMAGRLAEGEPEKEDGPRVLH